MKNLISAFLISVFLLSQAGATPAINNATVQDGQVSISGSGFGTVDTPLTWVSCTGKTTGNLINEVGWDDASSKYYYYSDETTNGIAMRTKVTEWPDASPLRYDVGMAGTDEIYFTFRTKIDFIAADIQAEGGSQLKWYCVRTGIIDNTSGWGAYPWIWEAPAGLEWKYTADSADRAGDYVENLYYASPTENTWFRVEIYGKRNSAADAEDGTWIVKHIRPDEGRVVTIIDDTSFNTHTVGDIAWRYAMFRNDLVNTSTYSEVDIFTDDLYVSKNRARVEMGNASTFAACTRLEIQPALTWSDTGITGTFNQGSFNNGDTVYFFVIDENGIPSDGYPVTIGDEPVIANPIVEILTESGQATTASVFAITGTATADTGQTISGVVCSGQTVTPDDGTWDEQSEAFTCLASLTLGENTLVFIGSDGTRSGSDSVTITRTIPGEYTTRGAGFSIKGCTLK